MGDVSHTSSEVIEGHREVKTFGSQHYEAKRFDKVNQLNRRQRMKKSPQKPPVSRLSN